MGIVAPEKGDLADLIFKEGSLSIAQGETRAFYILFYQNLLLLEGTSNDNVCSQANDLVDIFEGKAASSLIGVVDKPYIWLGSSRSHLSVPVKNRKHRQ